MACNGFSNNSLMGNWYEERILSEDPLNKKSTGKRIINPVKQKLPTSSFKDNYPPINNTIFQKLNKKQPRKSLFSKSKETKLNFNKLDIIIHLL